MAGDAERLEEAARVLADSAYRLDDSVRRLSSSVEAEVVYANLGWKGPAADQFLRATQERAARMRRVRDHLNSLAEQMRRQAVIAREEEQRQRAARQGH